MSANYSACVRELYESEILGEVLFLELLKVARNDRDRYPNKPILRSMIQPESAILHWLTTEAEGPSEASLDAVIAQLRYAIGPQ